METTHHVSTEDQTNCSHTIAEHCYEKKWYCSVCGINFEAEDPSASNPPERDWPAQHKAKKRRSNAGELTTLTDQEQANLTAMLRSNIHATSEACGMGERALMTAALGLPIRPGTAAVLRARLPISTTSTVFESREQES